MMLHSFSLQREQLLSVIPPYLFLKEIRKGGLLITFALSEEKMSGASLIQHLPNQKTSNDNSWKAEQNPEKGHKCHRKIPTIKGSNDNSIGDNGVLPKDNEVNPKAMWFQVSTK